MVFLFMIYKFGQKVHTFEVQVINNYDLDI